MQETRRNQCILVSGESGAGKTESTKYMIRHLMKLSPSDDESLLDKIVQVIVKYFSLDYEKGYTGYVWSPALF
jgi:myosin heavy subunit